MWNYLSSKIAEYSSILEWIEHEITELNGKEHDHLIGCLRDRIRELRISQKLLQTILSVGDGGLVRRAPPIIHSIEFWIYVLTQGYLPGLKREKREDLFLRNLLLPTAKRCGLSWVRDILVRLDGPYAISSWINEIPILFAPPQQTACVSDMTAVYHELGHSVFRQFREIGDSLALVVSKYFSELKQKVGPMTPEKRAERNRAINEAVDYWEEGRLNEIFSDVYAAFVCGPAYYFHCVDTAMRWSGNPFRISLTDIHPPAAARVYACYRTMLPTYENEETMLLVQRIWNECVGGERPSDFDTKCANALIDELTDASIRSIERLTPATQRYSKPSMGLLESKEILSSDPLEIILNKGATVLLNEPEYYPEWERSVFIMLQRRSGSAN